MIVRVDKHIVLDVHFDLLDREEGMDDEIRFSIRDSGPKDFRLFEADEISFLLTIEQAEQLALALQEASAQARSIPRSEFPGLPAPDFGDPVRR
jgi:hypothetical protein